MSELRQRLISGFVMAGAALALTIIGAPTFALLLAVIAIAVAWEWGRISRSSGFDMVFSIHAGATTGAIGLALLGYVALSWMVLCAAAIVALLLRFRQSGLLAGAGVLYTGLPAVGLTWIRSDPEFGLTAVLMIVSVVVATDTGAYAAGRSLGGPKLWPRVSPKKTWSGFVGGVAAGTLVAMAFSFVASGAKPASLAFLGFFLAAASQGGDLAESALKRHFGVKDSSGLIPGHGGFMDRMDGLVAAAILATLLAALVDIGAPGRALLTWN